MSSYSNFIQVILPSLPPNIILPSLQDEVTFTEFMMRLYEEIAFAVNSKDYNFFQIAIGSKAMNIPNLPMFGAFIVCVSGFDSTLPCATWALSKSTANADGVITELNAQAGSGAIWNGNLLTITNSADHTYFQIAHDLTGVTANFNIRIIGTQ